MVRGEQRSEGLEETGTVGSAYGKFGQSNNSTLARTRQWF